MVFTNATPAPQERSGFSPAVLPGSSSDTSFRQRRRSRALDEVDRTGVRVGVSEGSTSEATLSRELRNATVVRTPSLKAGVDLLASGQLEAFATNKATLFEMAGELPGSRVLDGRWGLESFAIGIPKGREAALPLVSSFVGEAKADGAVARAVERAGLRGTVVPN
jgi:polar amino acid transport system substrate-binding protein